jgi:sugar (pentulose or hexulose) kinase
MLSQLLHECEFHYIGDAIGAGSSIDDDSNILDTKGFEGVVFAVPITDSVATAVATLTAKQNTASSTSGAAATTATVAATCAVNDDLNQRLLLLEVHRPSKRYVYLNRKSETANIAYGAAFAILYRARKQPVSQLAAEVAGAAGFATPAEA